MSTEDRKVNDANLQSETKSGGKWGFSDKTGWEWLQLLIQLLAALAIPIAIALGTQWFSYQQNQTSLQVAQDQQRETTLETYLDRMSDLMLNSKLLDVNLGGGNLNLGGANAAAFTASEVARARTLTALRGLDPSRKGILLQFLYDSGLIGGVSVGHGGVVVHIPAIVDLRGADLTGANLRGATLHGADLSVVQLENAHLEGADFQYGTLFRANLAGANLAGANLFCVNLENADLSNADLTGANLSRATVTTGQLAQAKSLKGATMPGGSIRACEF